MSENKTAKTPTDSGVGFIDGVWHGPKAWQCQCGKPYTVTCISSKPPKREWVGLTEEDYKELSKIAFVEVIEKIERVLKEKNT